MVNSESVVRLEQNKKNDGSTWSKKMARMEQKWPVWSKNGAKMARLEQKWSKNAARLEQNYL
jgi:hypothetical protein